MSVESGLRGATEPREDQKRQANVPIVATEVTFSPGDGVDVGWIETLSARGTQCAVQAVVQRERAQQGEGGTQECSSENSAWRETDRTRQDQVGVGVVSQ